jgi:predicted DNA-binding transcriptional regulator AlpA
MDRIVRPLEAAELLGIGVSTLYEWLSDASAEHPLPRPRKVGPRSVGWPLSELEEFIRRLPRTDALPRATRRGTAATRRKPAAA